MQLPEAEQGPNSATELLIVASRALVAIAARSLGRVEDHVTLPQYRALVVLSTRGALRPVDLAESLEVEPSSVTRMCDRLIRKGLLERSHRDSDRREVEICLSVAGRSLVSEVTAQRRRDLRRVLSRISVDDQVDLIASLRVFNNAAGEPSEPVIGLGLSL